MSEFFPALMQLIQDKLREKGDLAKMSLVMNHSSPSKVQKDLKVTANGLNQPSRLPSPFSESILSSINGKVTDVDGLPHDLRNESSKCF